MLHLSSSGHEGEHNGMLKWRVGEGQKEKKKEKSYRGKRENK